jgi:hypothetical protein
MLAGEVPSQSFQSVARRRHKITKHCGVVQLHQFSAGDPGKVRRKPLRNASLPENQRRERMPAMERIFGWNWRLRRVISAATISCKIVQEIEAFGANRVHEGFA